MEIDVKCIFFVAYSVAKVQALLCEKVWSSIQSSGMNLRNLRFRYTFSPEGTFFQVYTEKFFIIPIIFHSVLTWDTFAFPPFEYCVFVLSYIYAKYLTTLPTKKSPLFNIPCWYCLCIWYLVIFESLGAS